MNYWISLVGAAAICAAGCSETNGSGGRGGGTAGAGGTAGMGGTAGVGGDGATGGVDPNIADHQKLLECRDDSACEEAVADDPYCFGVAPRPTYCVEAFAQVIELGEPFTMNNVACVLARLRDRTPGVYQLELDHTHTQGSEGEQHAFAITPSGMIERGVVEYVTEPLTERFLATERCEPKSPGFYDDCAQLALEWHNGGNGDLEAWSCVFPDWSDPMRPFADPPWFEGCTPLSPTCE